jgi:hypothetical protein
MAPIAPFKYKGNRSALNRYSEAMFGVPIAPFNQRGRRATRAGDLMLNFFIIFLGEQ